jgi:glycosyltransferase involved in cell wall biosynthesis
MPKVSVIIPTCNRPELLKRAIRSVLEQTFQDFEIIVVDDGMKVRAEESVREINDPRIRYIRNEVSLGGGGTRNRGIDEARGEYVAFLDDDDEWLPEKLQKQAEALDGSSSVVCAAFTGVSMFDSVAGENLHDFLPGISGPMNIFDRTLYRCFIWTSALMVRKSALAEERFDPEFKKNQEWDLQLRLAKKYLFFGIDEPLTKLNVLGENEHMGGRGNIANIARGYESLLRKHELEFSRAPKALGRQSFILGQLYREMGRFDDMKREFGVAWRARPTMPAYLRHYALSLLGERVYMVLFRIFGPGTV